MTDEDLYGQAKSLLLNKYGSLPEAGDTPGSFTARADAFRRKRQEEEDRIAQRTAEDAAKEAAKAERERASAIKSVASEESKNTKSFLEDTYPAAKVEAETRKAEIEDAWAKDEKAAQPSWMGIVPGDPAAAARTQAHKAAWEKTQAEIDAWDQGAKDLETNTRKLVAKADAINDIEFAKDKATVAGDEAEKGRVLNGTLQKRLRQDVPKDYQDSYAEEMARQGYELTKPDQPTAPVAQQPEQAGPPAATNNNPLPSKALEQSVAETLQKEVLAGRDAIRNRSIKDALAPGQWASMDAKQKRAFIEQFNAKKAEDMAAYDATQSGMSAERKATVEDAQGIAPEADTMKAIGQDLGKRANAAYVSFAQGGASLIGSAASFTSTLLKPVAPDAAETVQQFADGFRAYYDERIPEDMKGEFSTKLANTLGQIAGFIIPGGAVAKGAQLAMAAPKAAVATKAAYALMGVMMNGGNSYYEAKKNGASDPVAWGKFLVDSGLGSIEGFVGTEKLLLSGANKLTGGALGRIFTAQLAGASGEAVEEIIQNGASDVYDKFFMPENAQKSWSKIGIDTADAATQAFVGSLIFTAAATPIVRGKAKVIAAQQQEFLNAQEESTRHMTSDAVFREAASELNRKNDKVTAAQVRLTEIDGMITPTTPEQDSVTTNEKGEMVKTPGRATLLAEKAALEAQLQEEAITPEAVQIASDMTDGTTGKFAANEAEIVRLQTEIEAAKPSKESFFKPTDWEHIADLQAQISGKIANRKKLFQGDHDSGTVEKFRQTLADAKEIAKFPDAQADTNGNGVPRGNSQREIAKAIYTLATTGKLTPGAEHLIGANGKRVFTKPNKEGHIFIANPNTETAIRATPLLNTHYETYKKNPRAVLPQETGPVQDNQAPQGGVGGPANRPGNGAVQTREAIPGIYRVGAKSTVTGAFAPGISADVTANSEAEAIEKVSNGEVAMPTAPGNHGWAVESVVQEPQEAQYAQPEQPKPEQPAAIQVDKRYQKLADTSTKEAEEYHAKELADLDEKIANASATELEELQKIRKLMVKDAPLAAERIAATLKAIDVALRMFGKAFKGGIKIIDASNESGGMVYAPSTDTLIIYTKDVMKSPDADRMTLVGMEEWIHKTIEKAGLDPAALWKSLSKEAQDSTISTYPNMALMGDKERGHEYIRINIQKHLRINSKTGLMYWDNLATGETSEEKANRGLLVKMREFLKAILDSWNKLVTDGGSTEGSKVALDAIQTIKANIQTINGYLTEVEESAAPKVEPDKAPEPAAEPVAEQSDEDAKAAAAAAELEAMSGDEQAPLTRQDLLNAIDDAGEYGTPEEYAAAKQALADFDASEQPTGRSVEDIVHALLAKETAPEQNAANAIMYGRKAKSLSEFQEFLDGVHAILPRKKGGAQPVESRFYPDIIEAMQSEGRNDLADYLNQKAMEAGLADQADEYAGQAAATGHDLPTAIRGKLKTKGYKNESFQAQIDTMLDGFNWLQFREGKGIPTAARSAAKKNNEALFSPKVIERIREVFTEEPAGIEEIGRLHDNLMGNFSQFKTPDDMLAAISDYIHTGNHQPGIEAVEGNIYSQAAQSMSDEELLAQRRQYVESGDKARVTIIEREMEARMSGEWLKNNKPGAKFNDANIFSQAITVSEDHAKKLRSLEGTSGNRAASSIQRRYLAEAARIAGIPLKSVTDENDRLTAFMSGSLIEPRASVRDIVDGKRDSKAFMAALSANQAMWQATYGNEPVMVYRWASEDPQRSPMPEDVRQRIPNRRMTLMSYSAAPERVLAFTRRLNAGAPTLRGQWIAALIAPDQIATWGIMDADASHGLAKEIVALGQSTASSLASPTVDAKNGNQADLALRTLKEQATARKAELLASLQEATRTRNATSGQPSTSDQGTSQAEDTKAAPLPSDQSNQLAERRAQAELSTPAKDSQGRSNMLHSQAIPATTTSLSAIAKANKPVRFDNGTVLVPPDALFSQTAYHGTPHTVDRFTTEKIGTGEGAQAYGWGLYFAENPEVAENYQRNLTENRFQELPDHWFKIDGESYFDGLPFDVNTNAALISLAVDGYDSAKSKAVEYLKTATDPRDIAATNQWLKAIEEYRDRITVERRPKGNLYTVSLDVDPEDLLDWDKPLSEQSEKVRNALENDDIAAAPPYLTGADAYHRTASRIGDAKGMHPGGIAAAASEHLASLGIPGIRFLDQGSRTQFNITESKAGGKPVWLVMNKNGDPVAQRNSRKEAEDFAFSRSTRNYVIFDESRIKITHENDQRLASQSLTPQAPDAGSARALEKTTQQPGDQLTTHTASRSLKEDGIPGAIPQQAGNAVGQAGEGPQPAWRPAPDKSAQAHDGPYGIPAEQAFAGIAYAPARAWGVERLAQFLQPTVHPREIGDVISGGELPIYRSDYKENASAYQDALAVAIAEYRKALREIDAAYAGHPGEAYRMLPRTAQARALFTDATGTVHLLDHPGGEIQLSKYEPLFSQSATPDERAQSAGQLLMEFAPVAKPRAIDPLTPAQSQMVADNIGLAYMVANRATARGWDREEATQEASIGLTKAVQSFDAGRGVKFSTFAVPVIKNHLTSIGRRMAKAQARDGGSLDEKLAGDEGDTTTKKDMLAGDISQQQPDREGLATFRRLVSTLPANVRELMEEYGTGQTYEAIAQRRKVSRQAIQQAIQKGTRRLAERLKAAGITSSRDIFPDASPDTPTITRSARREATDIEDEANTDMQDAREPDATTDQETLNSQSPYDLVTEDQARSELGRSQPLESMVKTRIGWTEIGSLQPGDEIEDPEGGWQFIKAVYPQGILPVNRITLESGKATEASADHLWRYKDMESDQDNMVTTTENLLEGFRIPAMA